jgi:hypothetical protein
MPRRLVTLAILALAGGACSRHPTHGRPMPRDTVPTTKAPPEPNAPPSNEPGEAHPPKQ